MSVYVDEPIWPFGRMMMCHMVADTTADLNAMADTIGVARKWIQKAGTRNEHYDICKAKRALAVKAGAVELSSMDLGRLWVNRKSVDEPLPRMLGAGAAQ